jgi:peptidyl-prolyl cis-trans isomerase D
MLQVLRRGQRWILWLVIFLVGGAFVFFLGSGGGSPFGPSAQTAVAVGSRQFDFRDLDRVRERAVAEYRRALGDAFDPSAASDYIDQYAAQSLVQLAILAEEAERLGLRVGPGEMREYLRGIPGGTGADGRIDRDAWTEHAEREYGSVVRFEAALREDLLARKTSRLIEEAISLSEAEVREVLRYQLEEVRVAYVAVDPQALRSGLEVGDPEIEALLTADLPRVQAAYDARKSDFDQPEQVRARHILIRSQQGEGIDAERAEAEARAKAEQAAARIRGGEDFAKVAAQLSEDPGSKNAGGDLGFFSRGKMVAAFEDAAFSLAPGTVSDPLKTSYGFHVIRVEEKRPAKVIPFDEAKRALARELLLDEKAGEAADALVEKLLAAIREGRTLVDAARERGLTLERPDPLRRRSDGAIPGLGTSREALAAVFALTDDKPVLDRVFQIDGKRVLFERLGGNRPSDADLAPQVQQARAEMLQQRRAQLEAAWIDARRDEFEKSGELVFNLGARRGE